MDLRNECSALRSVATTLEHVRLLRAQVDREEQQAEHLRGLLQVLEAPATTRPQFAGAAATSSASTASSDSDSAQLGEKRIDVARSIDAQLQRLLQLHGKKLAEAERKAAAEQRKQQLLETLQQASLALATVRESALSLARACETFRGGVLQQLTGEATVSLDRHSAALMRRVADAKRANAAMANLVSSALRENVALLEADLQRSLQQHLGISQPEEPNNDYFNANGAERGLSNVSDISRHVEEAREAAQEAVRLLRRAASERRVDQVHGLEPSLTQATLPVTIDLPAATTPTAASTRDNLM